jgi:hypothetical protein
MESDVFFAVAIVLFGLNMCFLLRPVLISLFGRKNFLQILLQIIKIIFVFIKGILSAIFLRRVYYRPYSKNFLRFEEVYDEQILWVGRGSKKRGALINLSLLALMIISFLIGVFSC